MTLNLLLKYCHEIENRIDDIEYKFLSAVKEIRNMDAHALDLKVENNLKISGLLTAISGINKIAGIVYPDSVTLD